MACNGFKSLPLIIKKSKPKKVAKNFRTKKAPQSRHFEGTCALSLWSWVGSGSLAYCLLITCSFMFSVAKNRKQAKLDCNCCLITSHTGECTCRRADLPDLGTRGWSLVYLCFSSHSCSWLLRHQLFTKFYTYIENFTPGGKTEGAPLKGSIGIILQNVFVAIETEK